MTTLIVNAKIFQGSGLVAKDRNLFGKKTSSDPYVQVCVFGGLQRGIGIVVGKTSVKPKTLEPVWNENIRGTARNWETDRSSYCLLRIFDQDIFSDDDSMGNVRIPLFSANDKRESLEFEGWYDVDPQSAKGATGKIRVKIQVFLDRPAGLQRGNHLLVSELLPNHKMKLGLAWDMLVQPGGRTVNVDLDASLVAITKSGQISMPDTVYYGNPTNHNESILHSGDEREGDEEGDDESIFVDLNRVPSNIIAFYVILTVATPGMKLGQIKSTQFRVATVPDDNSVCTYRPADKRLSENATAMFMVRIARTPSNDWIISPIEQTHPTARDFGGLVPHLKTYSKDLIPNIRIDPAERIAIIRKHGNIRLTDYCSSDRLPDPVRFGLAWDVTGGRNIDLDASAICLDKDLNLVDLVWFKQLKSKDGSILHHGDEREGDEVGDDEKMDIYLGRVSPLVQYVGFVINSYSGEELDDISRAACHLFDPKTQLDIASYALTNSAELDKHTALLMGCLYRSSEAAGEWCLAIISEAAQGKVVRDNIKGLQNYLRRNPPQPPLSLVAAPQEITVADETYRMPAFVPYGASATSAPAASTKSTPASSGRTNIPKKFVNIGGVTKLNPEYKKWQAARKV